MYIKFNMKIEHLALLVSIISFIISYFTYKISSKTFGCLHLKDNGVSQQKLNDSISIETQQNGSYDIKTLPVIWRPKIICNIDKIYNIEISKELPLISGYPKNKFIDFCDEGMELNISDIIDTLPNKSQKIRIEYSDKFGNRYYQYLEFNRSTCRISLSKRCGVNKNILSRIFN